MGNRFRSVAEGVSRVGQTLQDFRPVSSRGMGFAHQPVKMFRERANPFTVPKGQAAPAEMDDSRERAEDGQGTRPKLPRVKDEDPERWVEFLVKRVLLFSNTLAGRLLIGPIVGTAHFLFADWRNRTHGPVRVGWPWHIPASLAVVAMVLASPMPFRAHLVACDISCRRFASGPFSSTGPMTCRARAALSWKIVGSRPRMTGTCSAPLERSSVATSLSARIRWPIPIGKGARTTTWE